MDTEYAKSICFYEVYHNPTLLNLNETNIQAIKRIFSNCFPEENYYEVNDASDSLIDIIEKSDQYIFGTLGKTASPVLQRVRDMEDKSTHPINLTSDEQLENYTYFLISFEHQKIAYVNSKSVPQLNHAIMTYINRQCFVCKGQISIIPLTINNPLKHIEKLSKMLSLDYTVKEDAETSYRPFSEADGDLGLKSVSYSLKFKERKKEAPAKRLASRIIANKNNYSNIKITGLTENGLEHVYSAIKDEIKLKKSLYLTTDVLENNQTIKQYLLDSFTDIPELLAE